MKREWKPAHTDYSVCLVGGKFAARFGGECDFWGGAVYDERRATKEAARLNRVGRKDGGVFVIREHHHEAGWVFGMTICLGGT